MEILDTSLSSEHRQAGGATRTGDTPDRDRQPAGADPAKGSPAKGAHRFGDDGAKAES